jgi:hypothetical protein
MKTFKELYSSAEEYNPLVLDKFLRFRSYLSDNPNKLAPLVSETLFNGGFRPTYKDGKKYAVCFSHDVDFIYDQKGKKRAVIDSIKAVKKMDATGLLYNLRSVRKPQLNPEWELDRLIDLENENHISASYYFLALEEGEEDHNYPIDGMKPYFKRISDSGSEIGLHGGHLAFNDREKIAEEKRRLEKACQSEMKGYRNHYLRFNTPKTWEHLENLDFIYDTTFGFADMPGYRNGMCYPFRPFNYSTGTFMDILELPLIVMDVSFWKYMGLDIAQSFTLFKKIASDVKKIDGVLTILWHNNCLTGEPGILFNKIFDFISKDEDAWFANSMELALFWKEKNLSSMEEMITANFNSVISA